MVTYTSFQV